MPRIDPKLRYTCHTPHGSVTREIDFYTIYDVCKDIVAAAHHLVDAPLTLWGRSHY